MLKKSLRLFVLVVLGLLAVAGLAGAADSGVWSVEKANAWYKDKPWLVGCNFQPSTAINQLEMFQADTFDLKTIDKELGWIEGLGYNCVRVYLQDQLWSQDREGFLKRLDQFLEVADRHHIAVMFVLFDSCWDPFPKLGKQRAPKPGVHNSGWVQAPGQEILKDPKRHDELKGYVTGVVGHFRADKRILAWDIFNEPDNGNDSSYGKVEFKNKPEMALALIQKAFAWAREAKPEQPLTAAVWKGDWSNREKITPLDLFMLDSSDIISFHNYDKPESMKKVIADLKKWNRPMICSEYMARPQGSTFQAILPILKENKVGGMNWGCVSGKTQTIYPWDSWSKTYTSEPPVWFHDIFRTDGTPYRPEETEFIQKITGKSGK
jgi:hypothetical protein